MPKVGAHRRQPVDAGRRQRSLRSDYKARKLNDTVVILVAVQTTAAQTGDVNSSRAFQTTSAITGLAGQIKTNGPESAVQCKFRHDAEGIGCDGFEHDVQHQHDGAGDRRAAQRQSGR